MRPVPNEPVKLFATVKTHKFKNIEDIHVEELKFRRIIEQTGTGTYNCSEVKSKSRVPLWRRKASMCRKPLIVNVWQTYLFF